MYSDNIYLGNPDVYLVELINSSNEKRTMYIIGDSVSDISHYIEETPKYENSTIKMIKEISTDTVTEITEKGYVGFDVTNMFMFNLQIKQSICKEFIYDKKESINLPKKLETFLENIYKNVTNSVTKSLQKLEEPFSNKRVYVKRAVSEDDFVPRVVFLVVNETENECEYSLYKCDYMVASADKIDSEEPIFKDNTTEMTYFEFRDSILSNKGMVEIDKKSVLVGFESIVSEENGVYKVPHGWNSLFGIYVAGTL